MHPEVGQAATPTLSHCCNCALVVAQAVPVLPHCYHPSYRLFLFLLARVPAVFAISIACDQLKSCLPLLLLAQLHHSDDIISDMFALTGVFEQSF